MRLNNKIAFDELDIKFLNELPLISEVLTSTSNKLGRFFSPMYQEIIEICNKNIPRGWEIDKKQGENVFYPFSSLEGREKITSLENYFQVKNTIILFIKEEKKWLNYVEIEFGLYYNEDYEDKKTPFFYFNLSRNPSSKFQGKLYPLSFYETIVARFKKFTFTVQHPENGHEIELIELEIEVSNTDRIIAAFEMFKNDILLPYLKGIKK